MSQKKEGAGTSITRRQMLAQAAKGAALASLVPGQPTQGMFAEATPTPRAKPAHPAAKPIEMETEKLNFSVDPVHCRWSAQLKGTQMQINDVYFLPGDDATVGR